MAAVTKALPNPPRVRGGEVSPGGAAEPASRAPLHQPLDRRLPRLPGLPDRLHAAHQLHPVHRVRRAEVDRSRQLPADCSTTSSSGLSLYNTLYYTALAVPIGVVVAMGLALAMNQPVPEVRILSRHPLLPSIIPLFALSFIFLILHESDPGHLQPVPARFGLPNVNWFGDPPGRNSPSSSSRSSAPGRWP